MNFEERSRAILELLMNDILRHYKIPEYLDADTKRDQINFMVNDLNAEWPIQPDDRFKATCQGLARALRASYSGREWPPIAVLLKAQKTALSPAAAPKAGAGFGNDEHLYQIVEEWWIRFRSAGPGSLPNETHAKRLVDANHATYGELWRRGFPIPDWAGEKARDERDSNHAGIMSDIQDMAARLTGQGISNPAFGGRVGGLEE